jgi:hypothetical protein
MAGTASPSTLRFDAPVGSAPRSRGVRLTRRGRTVVLLALVGLLLAAFTLGRIGDSQAAARGAGASARVPYASTTVHAGETLWSVAKRVAPGQDPRAVIQQIRSLNHLDTAAVQVGQQLLLPHSA